MVLVWIVARSRARVVVCGVGWWCLYMNVSRFILCGGWCWCSYIYVSIYALVVRVGVVVLAGGLLVCIWIDIYNGGSLVFCACVYLSDDKLLPKIKHFSRLNTVYMQKSAENRIFCMDICKTAQKIKIQNHARIVQYVYTIWKIEIEN